MQFIGNCDAHRVSNPLPKKRARESNQMRQASSFSSFFFLFSLSCQEKKRSLVRWLMFFWGRHSVGGWENLASPHLSQARKPQATNDAKRLSSLSFPPSPPHTASHSNLNIRKWICKKLGETHTHTHTWSKKEHFYPNELLFLRLRLLGLLSPSPWQELGFRGSPFPLRHCSCSLVNIHIG